MYPGRTANDIPGFSKEQSQQVKGNDYSSVLSAHKATSGIPCLVVASQYNRHGQTGRQTAQEGLLTWRKVKCKSVQLSAKQTLEQGPRVSVASLEILKT